MSALTKARATEYQSRLIAMQLRRKLYEEPGVPDDQLLEQLTSAEKALAAAERDRRAAQRVDASSGLLTRATLGAQTSGLVVTVKLGMDYVPTSVAHLLDQAVQPLVDVEVRNASETERRVRVSVEIDGYSAPAVDTVEIKGLATHNFRLLPVLRVQAIRELTELTRASLTLLVEDVARDGSGIELHRSMAVWLLARSTATFAVEEPTTGDWIDLSPFYGAFVTPNAPAVQAFLRNVARHHPDGTLIGYQGDDKGVVETQIEAMFNALKADANITYVNSVLTTSPREGFADQRVRVPRESLQHQEANCIDGAVLYASLIEGASMSPAIVVVPGHAFVACETWEGSGEWAYLETTMTGSAEFGQAREAAEKTAAHYAELGDGWEGLRIWPVQHLRTDRGIVPVE
jgi:hypothetical protein